MRSGGVQRKALAQGLDRLNEDVRTLADLAELAIRKAMDDLQRKQTVEAEEVATLDKEIYGLQLAVEKTCVDLIALHAPVAKDLRTITTCLGITTDLDRVGRYARDITEAEEGLRKLEMGDHPQLADLIRMGDLTIHMLDTAIRAFTTRDAESVKDISKFDDSVDDLHDKVFKELVQAMKDRTLDPEVGAHLVLVNRHLERIADHAVNIGHRVVYMVTGEGPGRGILPTKALREQDTS
ncbi:MAG: phosphate signaling complex protein PhoU [Euryarchaeota archaeon]|nr:phosphate signaling complex protein PhoU [Euryarchaeota archaeon]